MGTYLCYNAITLKLRGEFDMSFDWGIGDVLDLRPDLDDGQAQDVLFLLEDEEDVDLATLYIWADVLFPEE